MTLSRNKEKPKEIIKYPKSLISAHFSCFLGLLKELRQKATPKRSWELAGAFCLSVNSFTTGIHLNG